MHFLVVLWLSQQPDLVLTERGNYQLLLDALRLTHDTNQVLLPYERSLLQRMALGQMTVGHVLAYLQEYDQA